MYKSIGDLIQSGITIETKCKRKMSDDYMKQEKHIKFIKEVTIFNGNNMWLKCYLWGRTSSNKIVWTLFVNRVKREYGWKCHEIIFYINSFWAKMKIVKISGLKAKLII